MATKPKKADVASLAADAAGTAPAVDTSQAKTDKADGRMKAEWADYTDKHGRTFDASIHAVDKNGHPVINRKTKTLKIKQHGRKPLTESGETEKGSFVNAVGSYTKGDAGGDPAGDPAGGEQELTPEQFHEQCLTSAAVSAMIFEGAGLKLFGPDFAPKKTEAKATVQQTFYAYFTKTGPIPLTPLQELFIGLGFILTGRIDSGEGCKKHFRENVLRPVRNFFIPGSDAVACLSGEADGA